MLLSPHIIRVLLLLLCMAVLGWWSPTAMAQLEFDRCSGYNGVPGACSQLSCPALQHDLNTLPVPEFVARHGPACGIDRSGNKLVCCPDDATDLASVSCGRSSLSQHQRGGSADPGAWPWLAKLYLPSLGGVVDWTPVGCFGALISDRHVLVMNDCTLHKEIHVILGEYRKFNFTGVQNITSTVAVRSVHWTHTYHNLAILILDTPAKLIPNKVWPVCLSANNMDDLGFTLDGLKPSEKQLGFFAYWPSLDQDIGTIPMHQTQAFFSNCSAFCEASLEPDYFCPSYNASSGGLNPVCVGGMNVRECKSQSSRDSNPFVVQSAITREFFLVGLMRSSLCQSYNLNSYLFPVNPIVNDILAIIGK